MLERKAAILVGLIGIVTVLGFISGVAPGLLLSSYALMTISAVFFLLIIILIIVIVILLQQQEQSAFLPSGLSYDRFFNRRHTQNEQVVLITTGLLILCAGIFLGILCELLLKALSASLAVQLIIASVFVLILLMFLILLLGIGLSDSHHSKVDRGEVRPVSREFLNPTRSDDEPTSIAARLNRYHSDDKKSSWPDRTYAAPNDNLYSQEAPPNIEKDYSKSLNPSNRFNVNERVYVNNRDLAQVMEADGMGNYRIKYLDDGLVASKKGSELRRALPLMG